MVTPDPRRGDEPGDPNIVPGQPRPDSDDSTGTADEQTRSDESSIGGEDTA